MPYTPMSEHLKNRLTKRFVSLAQNDPRQAMIHLKKWHAALQNEPEELVTNDRVFLILLAKHAVNTLSASNSYSALTDISKIRHWQYESLPQNSRERQDIVAKNGDIIAPLITLNTVESLVEAGNTYSWQYHRLAPDSPEKQKAVTDMQNIIMPLITLNTVESLTHARLLRQWQFHHVPKGSDEQKRIVQKTKDIIEPLMALNTFKALTEADCTLDWQYHCFPHKSKEQKQVLKAREALAPLIDQKADDKPYAHQLMNDFINSFQPEQRTEAVSSTQRINLPVPN